MRNRKWNKVLGLVCAFALLITQLATGGATSVVGEEADETGYVVTVSADTTSVAPGDTVSLTATVKYNGEEITDLEAAGLYLWWWTDIWNDHMDGNSDATYSNYDGNSGYSLTADVTLSSEGTYYIIAELQDSTWADVASNVVTTITVADSAADESENNESESSGDESNDGYVVTVSATATSAEPGDTISLTATVKYNGEEITDLEAAGLYLWWWTDVWNDHTDGNSDAAYSNYDSNSGHSLTADVTLPSEGTYYIVAELQDSTWADVATNIVTTITVAEEVVDGYVVNVTASNDSPAAGDTVTLTATVKYNGEEITDLEAAGLYLWWWTDVWAEGHTDGLSDATYSNYDSGSGHSLTADVTLPSEGTYYIVAELQDSSYSDVCDSNTVVTFVVSEAAEDTTVYDAEINVEKVDGLSDDFVMGMDISSIISEFDSGVTYKDFDGNTIDNVTDFCKFLADDCGITHVRVRVWNDPYDSDGNGYGGGNCDVDKAVEIAEACVAAGLSLLVDFHYSDFWADPSKQDAPKAWSEYTLEEKETAIAEFTTDALTKIAATGVDIDMVQIGNETTGGLCGETTTANMCTLFNAASAAIRAFDDTIQIAVHITNPESGKMTTWAKNLYDNNVDYDILATSYYVYWHGTLENLISEMEAVQETYGKDVMVAETSYAYTLDDTDGHGNTVAEGSNDTGMNYSFTVQGQADCIRDVIAAVSEAGGLGVFYWEPAWITVGDTTGLTGDEYDAQVAANKVLWETYGSGWASSYAADYDPDDAGVWYGGSAVDNQAMFYADGTPTDSLKVWNYVKTGAVSNDVSVDSIATVEETIYIDGEYELPSTVTVTYNTGSVAESVVWDEGDISDIDETLPGVYTVTGTVTLSQEVTSGDYAGYTTVTTTYTLTVKEANLITDEDDAGFESGANFTTVNATIPNSENVYEGSYSMHWYQTSETTGSATYEKEITLEAGWYTFEVVAMGAAGDTVAVSILDTEGNELFAGDAVTLTGWTSNTSEWLTPYVTFYLTEETTVKLNVSLGITAGGWGAVDNMYLHQHETVDYESNDDGTHEVSCVDCGEILATESCTDVAYTSNGDGTHTVSCVDCNGILYTENCTDTTYTSNGDGTYTITCNDCGGVIEEGSEETESTETETESAETESTESESEDTETESTEDTEEPSEEDGEIEDTESEGDTESEENTEDEDTEENPEEGATETEEIESAAPATSDTEDSNASAGSSGSGSDGSGSSTTSPKTGDATPIIPIAVALLGYVAIVTAAKKRMV